ncbi:MAG TPA: permease-like cell division protein FtsX [Solirubrobacterales bacterium]|jgi:cell division transport system permease protein|nr:permease-like cell division protein FtsX [Solirubrobacterales bacterium]
MGRVFFFIGEGLRALRRSAAPSAAAIVTVAVTMVLLGVLVPVIQATSGKTEEVRDQVSLNVYLYDDATPEETTELETTIQGLPHVAEVEYVDKDEAMAILRDRLEAKDQEDLTAQLPGGHNPLPASFNIKPDDLDNLPSISAALMPPGADGTPQPISPVIEEVGESREEANTITKVTGALKWGLTIVAGLLLVASLLLVGNTIRLSIYARRREVEVMQLVGATNWFIRWPFVVEGIVCGLIGGLVAVFILFLGKETVVDPLADTFNLVTAENTIAFTKLTVLLLLAAMTVSAIGSGLTLRRFLRV